jgi:membrane protein YdbS with pleckstrin-like domain
MDSIESKTFRNDAIDTAHLPRYETVGMTPLQPRYWQVVLLNLGLLFLLIGVGLACVIAFEPDFAVYKWQLVIFYVAVLLVALLFSRLAFKRKAYAFRDHDVLYRHGIIATSTIVIPYNRVQHVALHEGVFARIFGLAEIRVFTAGGSGEIEIPGILKAEAEAIKQLLMGKIQKRL